ncbi:hypothetical protein AABB24_036210 [Solanum stoloniferum]|uniref:LysM domain-containing protein n=1 Tax=Solanum stoloniferum TaxID=62892 RepID=A0ABD2RDA6_9SOLN
MITKPIFIFSLLFFLSFIFNQNIICYAQNPPSITGYTCNPNQFNPCQTYVLYRARAPEFLDLASIGDLFSVSRLMIANPSNISNPNTTLVNDQPLFIPITCSCNNINTTFGSISYAGFNYTFKSGDTMYGISTSKYQNLTTYQSVEAVNPTVVPENIDIGQSIKFPIFCKCPNMTSSQNLPRLLISYVFQPNDNISSIASRFRVTPQSITQINGNNTKILDTLFIPLSNLPNLTQPASSNTPPPPPPPASPAPVNQENDRKGTVIGLAIGLGVCGVLLILVLGLFYREKTAKKEGYSDVERQKSLYVGSKKGSFVDKDVEVNLLADVSECLDKYKMYKMEQIWEATDGFDEGCLIQGSVYKGTIDGEVFAIKKMKWNAREELKILQKIGWDYEKRK